MPGTSAEILDDGIREIISPGRISTRDWITVIRTAHKVGIPTTSTIMYGHLETALDRARHLELLVAGVRTRVTPEDVLRMYAVGRLMLDAWIPNIQAAWVKQGAGLAQEC